MPTTNLISTPNITGNISSCTTNVSVINGTYRYNLWTQQDTGFATNNCTGATQTFQTWELTGFANGMMVGSFILIGIFGFTWFMKIILD